MVPKCREPTALASYPGSGNTWLRYLIGKSHVFFKYWMGFFVGFSLINSFTLFPIEGATGFFTGSRYKDLQIQMYGELLKLLYNIIAKYIFIISLIIYFFKNKYIFF